MNDKANIETTETVMDMNQATLGDLKSAGLVVSVVVNLVLFSAWMVVELTDVYNAQIISYLQK